MTDVTPDEADDWMARLGPDDIAHLQAEAEMNRMSPLWRAALERHLAGERGYGRKTGSHRRGRRG